MLLYKVIIFDFDGTILDTTKIKAEGFFQTLPWLWTKTGFEGKRISLTA